MLYQPPFLPALNGIRQSNGTFNTSADAPYTNGNPATGEPGSIPPADAFEHPQREIYRALTCAGIIPSRTNLTQLAEAITRTSSGAWLYYPTTGSTADALVLIHVAAYQPSTALFEGMTVRFFPVAANTGPVTLNVSGLGFKPLLTIDGGYLPASAFVPGRLVECLYVPGALGGAGAFLLSPWSMATQITPTAPFTVYVRLDGVDSNDGLADTPGRAFRTIGGAIYAVTQRYAPSAHLITVKVADGSWGGAQHSYGAIGHRIRVLGNLANPSACIITGNSGSQHLNNAALAATGYRELRVAGVQLTGADALLATLGGNIIVDGNVRFTATTNAHRRADQNGLISIESGYEIAGGAAMHEFSTAGGRQSCVGKTITTASAVSFSYAYAAATLGGTLANHGCTWTVPGNVTGKRYDVGDTSSIYVNGGGINYYPGNVAGVKATAGYYG